MTLNFRKAKHSDLEFLVALLADDALGKTREDTNKPLNQKYILAFEHIQNDPNNLLLVAEYQNQIAGMMQLTFIPYLTHTGSWRCLIEGVRIHKNFRGQGFGKTMILEAIEIAKSKNCNLVQLTSDKARDRALKFYEKLGFKASHEGFKLNI